MNFICHLQYTNLYYFPCPDTNGSLIHNFPPYINEEIFNEILIIKASIMVNIFIVEN